MGLRLSRRGSATWLIVGILFLCSASGCKERKAATYPVKIKVSYQDGAPIAEAQVVLLADDSKTAARGTTGADGSCAVTTFEPDDGAVLGHHSVIVAQPPHKGDPDTPYAGPLIAPRFSNPETSGLEVTVTEDESNNVFPITVTAR